MLLGEVVLREDGGETVLKSGDAAAWKAGVANGHCLVNRSDRDAVFFEVGTRARTERGALFRHRHEGRARRQGDALHEEEW